MHILFPHFSGLASRSCCFRELRVPQRPLARNPCPCTQVNDSSIVKESTRELVDMFYGLTFAYDEVSHSASPLALCHPSSHVLAEASIFGFQRYFNASAASHPRYDFFATACWQGITNNDAVLATALWRNLFLRQREDLAALSALVAYVRREVNALDTMPSEILLAEGAFTFGSLPRLPPV